MSARLLILTVFFVMVSEVLIYVPSIARFRQTFLEDRVVSAHLASLALKATPDNMVSKELELELLASAMVRGIVLKRREARTLMLTEEMPPEVDAAFDLRDATPYDLIRDAFAALWEGERTIRVIGGYPDGSEGSLEVVIDEDQLHAAMVTYSTNILQLSIVISLITAGLVYLALQFLLVLPMRRLTASMVDFRREPENTTTMIADSGRGDEIGTAQRELRHMQDGLRAALKQRAHLAALGTAVSKINHDLRNILATAQIVSDGLAGVEDPTVRRVAPRLMQTIDRAIDLCSQTMSFGRAEEAPPEPAPFPLGELVDEVADFVGLPGDGRITWSNRVDNGLNLNADREQIFRVLLNLGRNAMQAMPDGGEIRIEARPETNAVAIEVSDTGGGLPEKAREHLFEPFTGSARAGGTGLGLAIARDLVVAHGGNLTLLRSDAEGTTFRIDLPDKT
ncbi:MAG: HAMP domain-containing sensor histidine kinase [Alphaproteobacteria bacterium]|nr:HAMP domain-containing sensor histidine kinase [Alphaproteobacteria bacterium]